MRARGATPLLVVATLTAAGAAAAAGYGLTAPKHYRATAQLLVAPVSAGDETFAGLDVLRDASGKPRAAETAAVLVHSPQVVEAVRTQLGIGRSLRSIAGELHAHVAGSSNVVDVTVEDTSPATAAQLANALVDALIAQRTTAFQSQLAGVIRRDSQLLAANSSGPQAAVLSQRLAVLRGLQGQPDPSIRRASSALPPTTASSTAVWALVLIGAGVGLALGALSLLALTLLRGRTGGGAAQYARPMSDRTVNALVDRLEQRLAARESALAVRERELQAKIDELRALDARGDVAQARALEAKEAELEAREQALLGARDDSSQAEALRAKEAELDERERALAERIEAVTRRELAAARAAAAATTEASGDLARRDEELARRERELEGRVAAVQQREMAAARAAAKEAAILERERALDARESAAEVDAARDNSSQALGRPPAVTGAFNLTTLEGLVAERRAEFPERRDEWESTVYFLRDYAESDGTLPGSFDWLVQETFAPLLD